MKSEATMRSFTIRCLAVIAAAACVALAAQSARADTLVDDPADICSPTADPCLVTNAYDVAPGSTLDFGARALVVQGGGQLDFQEGPSTILCGDFTVLPKDTFARILVRAGGVGGTARIVARGRCALATSTPCLTDSDCTAGVCAPGTGDIDLDDQVSGYGSPGGTFRMVAHDSIITRNRIDLDNGGTFAAEGGTLEIETREGPIEIGDTMFVQGGAYSAGGTVLIRSGADLTIDGEIDATGGQDGGGTVDLMADGDIFINNDIKVRSASGSGVGGEIHVNAEGNVTFAGVGPTNRTVMDSMGHRDDMAGESGDGGGQSYNAAGSITVGPYALFEASAPDQSNPDASGGEIELSACNITVQSTSELESNGKHGGIIRLLALSSMTINSAATVEATNKPDGAAGRISLILRPTGTCSNSPTTTCLFNSECVIGCSTGTCNNSNLNTAGSFSQFNPAPDIEKDQELPTCD